MTHDDDIPENPDEQVSDETGTPSIDYIVTDEVPELQPDEDFDDDVEGVADGHPIPSVYGSELQEGIV